jgi:hypothetical protein
MRGARLALLVLGPMIAALATGSGACFSPHQPACAFSCAVSHECPTGYACGGDGLCHRADGQGHCSLDPSQPDAGTSPPDGGSDGDAPGS